MMRQAVPVVRTDAPIVGTGTERIVARDSGAVLFAKEAGKVIFVDSNRIVVQRNKFKEGESGVDIYKLVKYQRTNQNTCNNQKALVKEGDIVNVTGTSKGKGFAGVMKRHGFSGGPKTHGQREYDRAPGSIGQGSDPSRVYKGMRMAGHMGVEKVTVRNLEIVRVDSGKNQLLIKGAVPGVQNSFILIKK